MSALGCVKDYYSTISYHFTINLDSNGIKWGPSPFRLKDRWLKVTGFQERIKDWWNGMMVEGKVSYRVAKKLWVVKEEIKKWCNEEGRSESTIT